MPRTRSFGALVGRIATARSYRPARPYYQPAFFRRHASTAAAQDAKRSPLFNTASFEPKESSRTPQTLTEKILQRYSVGLPEGKTVRSGDYVQIRPHRCLTHDNTWPVATKFMSIGATRIEDPSQLGTARSRGGQDEKDGPRANHPQFLPLITMCRTRITRRNTNRSRPSQNCTVSLSSQPVMVLAIKSWYVFAAQG